ncbi:MAG: DUF2089 domain-containing protein [Clostridia bacterium]|nr:DUF2089 domain-containing protein [Clostridia bacterium]
MATVEYKCPNCAAPLVFDASKKTIKCDFCDSEFTPSVIEDESVAKPSKHINSRIDSEYIEGEKAEEYWMKMEAQTAGYSCPSCGGAIICTENSAALFCPYCGNPAIIESSLEGQFRPDYIIPFSKTKDQAVSAYKAFVEKYKFLPKAFRDSHAPEKISGIYVPYHLMSCSVAASATYTGETEESWTVGDTEYTKTNHYSHKRAGKMSFNNVPSDASTSIADEYTESVEPFDYGKIEPFKTVYLTGFLADKYDKTPDDCRDRMDSRVIGSISKALKNSVTSLGYENVTVQSHSENISDRTFSYALLPLWLLRTKFNDKYYYFAMNGQTGKVAGKLPTDGKKINLSAFLISLIGLIIGFLVYLFNENSILYGVIAFIISSLILFFVSRGIMYGKASNVASKYDADYYSNAPVSISVKEDTFMYSNTTSRRIKND